MLYDSHAHLDLVNENEIEPLLKKAKENGVEEIISCATSFYSNEKILLLSKKYPEIKSAIGLYPLDAVELSEEEIKKAFNFFEEKIKKAFAIGEVGMDFKYSTSEKEQEKQIQIFTNFIELSKKYNKPLIIHSRFAQRQVLELLEKNNAKKVLLHSFVDSEKLMKKAVELGYFVSCGLNVLENEQVQKNIKSFPIENLLFETDSPIKFGGENANPSKIKYIAEKVSELKEMTFEEIEQQQEKNYKKIFE
jgi:TatD DNase family protein